MKLDDLRRMKGADLLRLVTHNINYIREDFLDRYTVDELLQLYRMCLLSEWDVYPDEWTKRQVKEALLGIVPQWSKDERPMYLSGDERRAAIERAKERRAELGFYFADAP